jgi:curved DNA-binding protein CbpA
MGSNQSFVDPAHVHIYSKLIKIQDPLIRANMINKCLTSAQHVQSAKTTGIYTHLIHYISAIHTHDTLPILPGEQPLHNTQLYASNTSHHSSNTSIKDNYILSYPTPTTTAHPVQTTQTTQLTLHKLPESSKDPHWKTITQRSKEKAISYFSACLEVLNIQEEVELTLESLRSAYRKMALRTHPDKGGSEEQFEAVTRAYAYLTEILTIMKGRQSKNGVGGSGVGSGVGKDVNSVAIHRENESKQWAYGGKPVKLNADKLDLHAFNKLFEETHIPDPDSDGYGDWLKTPESASGATSAQPSKSFNGQFNRDVFNRMFEDDSKKSNQSNPSTSIIHINQMAMTLNPSNGTDLLNERPDTYTTAPNSKFQFSDLRGAYTSDSTITDKVSNVVITDRNYDQYKSSREKAPDPFTQTELHGIRDFENRQKSMDDLRERKRAEMGVRNQNYFEKMKQLVITDATDLNKSSQSNYPANQLTYMGGR